MKLPRCVVLDKAVGQTPLQCMEAWRIKAGTAPSIPLTYAGRLDPMASGKLIVLIGQECKKKEEYLALDKTYEFSVLFGIGSDTHDVLGRLHTETSLQADIVASEALGAARPRFTPPETMSTLETELRNICTDLTGEVELPYPHFSSKTVDGKPLFQWALEGRIDEIEIPTKQSTIYSLTLDKIETLSRSDVCDQAHANIDTIPEVTESSKQPGADFRRADVRADWEGIKTDDHLPDQYHVAHFTCSASSGTYMRTLAKLIGEKLDPAVPSLAWHIHRTHIGNLPT